MGLRQDGPLAGWVSGKMGLRHDGPPAGWVSGRMGLRQDGPPEVRFPRDTWPASKDFRKKILKMETPLQVSGHTRTKPRLCLYELVKEVMEQSGTDSTSLM